MKANSTSHPDPQAKVLAAVYRLLLEKAKEHRLPQELEQEQCSDDGLRATSSERSQIVEAGK